MKLINERWDRRAKMLAVAMWFSEAVAIVVLGWFTYNFFQGLSSSFLDPYWSHMTLLSAIVLNATITITITSHILHQNYVLWREERP